MGEPEQFDLIHRDRTLAMEPSAEWQDALDEPDDLGSIEPGDAVALAKPIDTAKIKHLEICGGTETVKYQWIIPAHKAGDNLVGPGEHRDEASFTFDAAPTGFCRSGFGLRLVVDRGRRGRRRAALQAQAERTGLRTG